MSRAPSRKHTSQRQILQNRSKGGTLQLDVSAITSKDSGEMKNVASAYCSSSQTSVACFSASSPPFFQWQHRAMCSLETTRSLLMAENSFLNHRPVAPGTMNPTVYQNHYGSLGFLRPQTGKPLAQQNQLPLSLIIPVSHISTWVYLHF